MRANHDIFVSGDSLDDNDLGCRIKRTLNVKGFCIVNGVVSQETRKGALLEIDGIQNSDRFYFSHDVLQTGMLGETGSTRIARLHDQELLHPALDSLIGNVDAIGWLLKTCGATFEFELRGRTPTLLHDFSQNTFSLPRGTPFTDSDVLEWLDWHTWSRILIIFFVGPSLGSLMLTLNDEDALPYTVAIEPGTCVILRSDKLNYSFEPSSPDMEARCYAVCAWFLENMQKHSWLRTRGMPVPGASQKCYQGLDEWLFARLQNASVDRDRERHGSPDFRKHLPGSLELAMKSLLRSEFAKHTQIAITGAAYEFPSLSSSQASSDIFSSIISGVDLAIEVPIARWDHSLWYGLGSSQLLYTKHCCMAKTWDLFDNMFFGISRSETESMSGQQKKVLQTSYAALHNGGLDKKSLQRSQTGVYVAISTHEEYVHIEAVENLGCGYAGEVVCGRVGFVLNLMGPSLAIEADGASSLLAVQQGMNSLRVEHPMNIQAIVSGAYRMSNPSSWKYVCSLGLLTRTGRCMSFDEGADGYGKSEGVGTIFVKSMTDIVGSNSVYESGVHGAISSFAACSDGRKASLVGPPHGTVVQSILSDVTFAAGLMPIDVDAVELHASGVHLEDALEYAAVARTFCDGFITVGAGKTNMMYAKEAAGMPQVFKAIQSLQYCAHLPNLHLGQLNSSTELLSAEVSATLPAESMPLRNGIANSVAFSYGWGGSNVSLLFSSVPWTQSRGKEGKDEAWRQFQTTSEAPLSFWPGGSRDLEHEVVAPSRAYTIVGSWSSWSKLENMRWEGNGTYGYIMTLGENRYEHFQIWLDGNPNQILHPGVEHAPNGSAALFSNNDDIYTGMEDWDVAGISSFSWQLDGRGCTAEEVDIASGEIVPSVLIDPHSGQGILRQDKGKLGDQYHIRLHVAGKYRMVDWGNLAIHPSEKLEDAVLPSTAKYYIVGDWAGWKFQEMSSSEISPGAFYFDVVLENAGGEFQIIRDRDWNQVFWPSEIHGEVSGPSIASDRNWKLNGVGGERFRVEFERKCVWGNDQIKISWQKAERKL